MSGKQEGGVVSPGSWRIVRAGPLPDGCYIPDCREPKSIAALQAAAKRLELSVLSEIMRTEETPASATNTPRAWPT